MPILLFVISTGTNFEYDNFFRISTFQLTQCF